MEMGWVQGMTKRVRPFTKGADFLCWKRRNCERCTLGWQAGQGYQCDLEAALDYAYMDKKGVTETIGKSLKFDGEHVAHDCPECVLVEANVDSAE
jgi:predicted RNA-binding Zn-ribbon protein involved in translation (DUF1610 family)